MRKNAYLTTRELPSKNVSIVVRFIDVNNKPFTGSTGIILKPNQLSILDKGNYISNPNHIFSWEKTEEKNNQIREELNRVNKALSELPDACTKDDLNQKLDPAKYGVLPVHKKKNKDVLDYFDIMIADTRSGERKKKGEHKIAESTIKQYESSKRFLKAYCEETNTELTVEYLYGKFWNDFRKYMHEVKNSLDSNVDTYYKDLNTVMNYVENIARVVDLDREFRNRSLPRLRETSETVIFLLPDEMKILEMLDFKDTDLNKCKDLFLFQKDNMLRVSELYSYKKENIRKVGNLIQAKIYSQKTDKYINHDLSNDCINILEKYNYTLPLDITTNQYNILLKKMVRKLGEYMNTEPIQQLIQENDLFTRDLTTHTETVKKNVDGEIKNVEELIENEFSSHCARKSGICEMIMGGIDEHTIRKKSGHSKTSKEFARYYDITENWMNKKIVEAQNKRSSQKLYINKHEAA